MYLSNIHIFVKLITTKKQIKLTNTTKYSNVEKYPKYEKQLIN